MINLESALPCAINIQQMDTSVEEVLHLILGTFLQLFFAIDVIPYILVKCPLFSNIPYKPIITSQAFIALQVSSKFFL